MKHLQIFVLLLIVGLVVARRGRQRREGSRGKRFPKLPKLICSSESDCPSFATCVNMELMDKSICLPKKMVDMMEKKISQLPSLESCSVDSDCNNVGKCEEVQNLGVRMCMPAFVRRMLRKNSAHLAKTCISENECAGSSKCMEFPKFEKHICLFENGLLHKMMVSIHDKFVKEDKDQPDNDTIEGKEEGKEDEGPEGENNLDNDDDDNNDDIDDDMDDAPFISDPQFLTKIDDNDEKFNNFIRTYRSYRKRGSWNMFFMGVFSMAGVVVLILFALLCCLTVKKRMAKKNIAKEESGEGGNNKLRNMFLTKIGTVQNPYSKLEEEKGVRI